MFGSLRSMRLLSLASLAPWTVVAICAKEPDPEAGRWPSWRGPESRGSTQSGGTAVEWSATKNLAWKVELPGKGCSTPIVWDAHIIVTAPDDGQDAVLDFDPDGKERWRATVGKARGGKHRNGSGSNPSAVTDGDGIFVYYRSGNLARVDFDGKVEWRTNLQERFGKDTLWWDIGTSPVLTAKHVVVAVMHEGEGFLVAFDKKNGDLGWKVDRKFDCAVEGDHSYTTPIVVRRDGREVILVWGAEHLTGHAAADGKLLWSCGGFNPQRASNRPTIASVVVAGDMVVAPFDRGSKLAGVRLGGRGDVTETHRAWTVDGKSAFVPSPAVANGKVYVVRDRGEVVCVNPETGDTIWSGQLPKHRAKYYSSPLVAGDKLYAPREDGVIFVAGVKSGLELLAENDMEELVVASPVPLGNRLLLRGAKHLFCVAAP